MDVKHEYEALDEAVRKIRWSLSGFAEMGVISTGRMNYTFDGIRATISEEAVGGLDFVTEAVVEGIEVKKMLSVKMDEHHLVTLSWHLHRHAPDNQDNLSCLYTAAEWSFWKGEDGVVF